MSNLPLSEQYRLAAQEWVDLDNAASLLEESKSAYLSRAMAERGDVPVAHAERDVKGSQDWQDYIDAMCLARKRANEAKVRLEWVRMRFAEQQSIEATKRAEMKL